MNYVNLIPSLARKFRVMEVSLLTSEPRTVVELDRSDIRVDIEVQPVGARASAVSTDAVRASEAKEREQHAAAIKLLENLHVVLAEQQRRCGFTVRGLTWWDLGVKPFVYSFSLQRRIRCRAACRIVKVSIQL